MNFRGCRRKAVQGVSSRWRIEKKEEKETEHKPEGTHGCTRLEVFGKDAMKKTIATIHIQSSIRITELKIDENWKIRENMTKTQVQSGATAHQTIQPSRAERQLYDSCEQKPVGSPKFWLNGSSQRALVALVQVGFPLMHLCTKPVSSIILL